MINIKPLIIKTLRETGYDVYYSRPDSFKKLPIITFTETNNISIEDLNNNEIASEITLQVDVWNSNTTSAIAIEVDKKMKSIGFKRIAATDMDETDIRRKMLMYTNIMYN